MGDHTRVVPSTLSTKDGHYELKAGDLFVEIVQANKKLFLEGIIIPKEIIDNIFVIKTFEIKRFKHSAILWQIGEGLFNCTEIMRFGYDKKLIPDIIYKTVAFNFFDKAMKTKKPIYIIITKGNNGLEYKEVAT